MNEKISVIVPVYNTSEQYLSECIISILNSNYTNIEVLIIDDGSDRDTAKQCDNLGKSDGRIKVIHQMNRGVSIARNCGIQNATGEYIAFVDSDDTIEANMLQTLHLLCEKNSADIAICKCNEVHGDKVKKKLYTHEEKILVADEIIRNFYLQSDIGWVSFGKLVKLEIAKQAMFPEKKRTAEDMFFVWQLCKLSSRVVLYDKPFYNYRKNEKSTMADKNLMKFFDTADLLGQVWKCENKSENLFRTEANTFFINNEIWFIRFMIARGARGEILKKLMEIRTIILNETNLEALKYLDKWRRREYLLLKKAPLCFYLLAKIQMWRMKE